MSAISYVPFMQGLFGTGPLRLVDWVLLVAFGAMLFFAEELRKLVARRKIVKNQGGLRLR
jgi:hypothetical protein